MTWDLDLRWHEELLLVGRTLFAALLGALIGWERKRDGKSHGAGIRTYAAVALGACSFGLVSAIAGRDKGADRIAAQVVSGIGFLGAGVILRDEGKVKGLTTAATLWATASLGLAVAYGAYILAMLTTAIVYLMLALHRYAVWKAWISPPRHNHAEAEPCEDD